MAYRIEYDSEARDDLRALGQERNRALDAIETHLRDRPNRETRARKPLRPAGHPNWELRAVPFRVFYNVDEAEQRVYVTAVLWKVRERWYRRPRKPHSDE